jgi:NitT/TauT family transport system permease protein
MTALSLRRAAASPALGRLIVIAMLLAIWEVSARWLVDPMFLAPPSQVVWRIGATFGTRGVPGAIGITLLELVVAFALSAAIGIAAGLLLGLHEFSRKSFMPMVLLVYGMPQITILPLFILYFGIGPASKIAFGVTHGTFPIVVTVAAGVQNIRPILVTCARSMGADFWQRLRYVIFPHVVPTLFTGMRLGMTGVLLGVLLAELYVSTAGIGYFTTLFTQNFDPTKLLGLVGTLAAIAIVLNALMRRLERRFGRWRD